jgi:hypothetical protein
MLYIEFNIYGETNKESKIKSLLNVIRFFLCFSFYTCKFSCFCSVYPAWFECCSFNSPGLREQPMEILLIKQIKRTNS